MKNELLQKAAEITVINDGQFKYPVLTSDLSAWRDANGAITAGNYEKFCDEVDFLASELGTPGNAEIIDLCDALVAAGANTERLENE